ncbi:MAG: MerR family transcriptional regulator [Pseudomonadota bacterium]
MSDTPAPLSILSSISEVERDTGIAKETLRVWERRYDFPRPQRDPHGERLYSQDQVARLRLVKRLLDQGHRPGKLMHQTTGLLAEMAGKTDSEARPAGEGAELAHCIALLKSHQLQALRQHLAQAVLLLGMRRFVCELVAPLTDAVGAAWAAGQLAVFEEHLYSEALQGVLRHAIFGASQHANHSQAHPRVLLSTLPQERHGLGLLMVEALLTLEGAHCFSLGVQTPMADIVDAARAQHADVVALSFSSGSTVRGAVANVQRLQQQLGPAIEVWAGGACAQQARRQLGRHCVVGLDGLAGMVTRWRGARQLGAGAENALPLC